MSSEEQAEAEKPAPKVRKTRGLLLWLTVLHTVGVLGAILLLAWMVDRMWLATLLAYLPRWLIAIPGVALLLLTLVMRRWRLVLVVLVTLAVEPLFIGDYRFQSAACAKEPSSKALTVLTQNSLKQSLKDPWLRTIVEQKKIDLILVQECQMRDLPGGEVDPVGEVESPLPGFQIKVDVSNCLLSRYPIKTVDLRDQHDAWEKGGSAVIGLYEIAAPFGPLWVLNVHLMTVRPAIQGFRQFGAGGFATLRENTELREWESKAAREWSKRAKGPLLVIGDFNLPRESQVFQSAWGDLGDAFGTCGQGFGYSKETRSHGIEFGTRIDHVLFDQSFGCSSAELAPPMGSDHRGVIAGLFLR